MRTTGRPWQDTIDQAIQVIAKSAGTTVENVLAAFASDLESPLRPSATFPTPDGKINFTVSPSTLGDGAKKSLPPMKTVVYPVVASTLDFQSITHATTGATFNMTWPTSNTLNYYRRVGFATNAGTIYVMFSPETATLGALPNAGTVLNKKFTALGWIDVQCTDITDNLFKSADAVTPVINNTTIYRFGSGSGSGGGGLDTYTIVADATAEVNGADDDLAFIVANETIYRYEATTYAAVVSDGKFIIDVTSNVSARWVAVAGRYQYQPRGDIYALVADMQAVTTGIANRFAFCSATETWYKYTTSAVTADGKSVIDITSDVASRWIAVSGKYTYIVPGSTYLTVADMKAVTTGLDTILVYCVANETYYRYEATALSAVPGDDLSIITVTSDANARWMAIAGQYSYVASSGGASDILTRMEIFLNGSVYNEASPIVFGIDLATKTDVGNSTGTLAGSSYNLTTGQIFRSLGLLDTDAFIANEQDIPTLDVTAFYDVVDTAPVIAVSRNGGVDWQTVTSEREQGTDLWQGTHSFTEETNVTLDTHANLTGTPGAQELDNAVGTNQSLATKFTSTTNNVYKVLEIYVNKTGSPTGTLQLQLARDNAGVPSTDFIATYTVDISTLTAGLNTITMTLPTTARKIGTYWVQVVTDAAYKSVYVASTHSVALRGDTALNGNTYKYNGTVWSASTVLNGYFATKGRVLDLQIRVTASMTSNITGLGLYYGSDAKMGMTAIDVYDYPFSGDLNIQTFTLPFLPNPTMLRFADAYNGAIYHGRVLAYNGYQVTVPVNFFDRPGVDCRAIFWHEGAAFDTADLNAANILTATNNINKIKQNTWYFGVAAGPTIDYTDWSALMTAVSAGDTIVITKGSYAPTANYVVSKSVLIQFQRGATFDGTSAGTKGFSVTANDVIMMFNGALMQNWNTSGDYAVYCESGALRTTVVDGRFTGNYGDVFTQVSTVVDRNVSY